jgi:hypothetical protein
MTIRVLRTQASGVEAPWLLVGLLFAASWVRFAGVANGVLAIPLLLQGKSGGGLLGHARDSIEAKPSRWWLGWAVLAAAIVPLPLWLLRNLLRYGVPTFTHAQSTGISSVGLLAPISYGWGLLTGVEGVPVALLFAAVLGLIIYPLFRLPPHKGTRHWLLVALAGVHIVVVWLASLFLSIDPVGHRLIDPGLVFAVFAALAGLALLADQLNDHAARYIALAIPFVFLLADKEIRIRLAAQLNPAFEQREEQLLWDEIETQSWASGATHFYTDEVFLHQVFADMPQRIVWESRAWQDPIAIVDMLNTGHRPFIILRDDGQEEGMLEATIEWAGIPLVGESLGSPDYTVYHLP